MNLTTKTLIIFSKLEREVMLLVLKPSWMSCPQLFKQLAPMNSLEIGAKFIIQEPTIRDVLLFINMPRVGKSTTLNLQKKM